MPPKRSQDGLVPLGQWRARQRLPPGNSYRFAFDYTTWRKQQAGDPLRFGRPKAVLSLRSGDPQRYDLTRVNANQYQFTAPHRRSPRRPPVPWTSHSTHAWASRNLLVDSLWSARAKKDCFPCASGYAVIAVRCLRNQPLPEVP